jgi:hypothetical protein
MASRAEYAIVTALTLVTVWPHQGNAPRKLGAPTAKLAQEFTGIDGLREMRDGRVLVLDSREKLLHLIDMKSGTGTKLGREGDGPGEFRLMMKTFSLGGDSVGISDMSRAGRLMVVRANGELGALFGMIDSSLSTRTFNPLASDNAGRFYTLDTRNPFLDSTSIVRWDVAKRSRDTVAKFMATPISPLFKEAPEVRQMNVGGNVSYSYRPGPIMPFATANQWAVAGDGRIALIYPQPYHVTIVGLDGRRVEGPNVSFVPVTVGDAEKAAFIKQMEQPNPGVRFTGRGSPPIYGYTARKLSPEDMPPAWPPTMPAVPREAGTFASDGMLWVKRNVKSGAPILYDVFDTAAKLSFSLELPPMTKVVGFGAGSVYLARFDEDDLHYLERYALPTARPVRP